MLVFDNEDKGLTQPRLMAAASIACSSAPATRCSQAPSAVQRAMLALLADGVLGLPQLACCPACCAMQVEIMDACPDCRSDYKGFVFFDNQDSR